MPYTTDFRTGGKRYRRTFSTSAEAKRFEAYVKSKSITGEWNPQKKRQPSLV